MINEHLLYAIYRTIKPQERESELKYDLLSFCRQIALGLNYLVSKQFVHRDLAARNILVSDDDVCKVGCMITYYRYCRNRACKFCLYNDFNLRRYITS